MDTLALIKMRLGISVASRDEYLTSILNAVKKELDDIQGLTLDEENPNHQMFLVDYVDWRYSNRDNPIMPRHLQWRLHNLMVGGRDGNI